MFTRRDLHASRRRRLLTAAVATAATALVLVASTPAGARPAVTRVTPRAAVCASASQLSEHLTGNDLTFLRRFVPCELEKLRGAHAGRLLTSAELSRDASGFLNADTRFAQAEASAVIRRQANGVGSSYCAGKRHDADMLVADSSPPPVLTPAAIEAWLAYDVKRVAAWHQPGTVFGLGYVQHLIFEDTGIFSPVAFGVLVVHCG